MTTKLRHSALALLIVLLAFFLRTYRLDDQSLRGDEAATVLYAALPISDLWELSRVTDPHPPFYYLLLHPWQWLIGEMAWVMRFAGVTASVLAVAMLYALSRRTLPATDLCLLAAALLTVNPLQIWQAQDIRSYPFFTLFGLLSSWALWSALNPPRPPAIDYQPDNKNRPRSTLYILRPAPYFFSYILFTVISFYTHYYTVFLIVFQGLFVLINYRVFWPKRWSWLISQFVIGLLILPGLQLASNFIGQAAGGIDTIPTAEILRRAATALLTGFTLDQTPSLWAVFLLTPIALVGLIVLLRRDVVTGLFWGLFFAIPVAGVIALSIDRPFFKERFLIQAQPAFELLLAAGFTALWRLTIPRPSSLAASTFRLLPSAFFLTLLAFNFLTLINYFTQPTYAKAPPWRLFHNYVSDHAQAGDVMFTNFPEAAVSYYSPNELPFYVAPVERDRSVAFRLEETEKIAGAYDRIWFLPLLRQGFDEEGEVLQWLDRHADRVDQIFFPVYNINLYLTPPTVETLMIRHAAVFAHGVRLRGYQIFDEQGQSRLTPLNEGEATFLLTLKPKQDFTLSLYWQAAGPTDVSYTVFTQLIAADGFNRTGQDNLPVWGSYPTTTWREDESITDKYTLSLPEGTPAGDHRLHLGWYHSDTGERVPLLDEAGQPVADQVVLGLIVRVE